MRTIPDIPIRYTTFPDDYVNDVRGWAFDEATIKANAGSLLTLDIDYGSNCSLNCPFCFRRNNSIDELSHELRREDLRRILREAKDLGLRTVKLLGAGEPLENPYILEFLKSLHTMDIIPVVFTKTGVIGDDAVVNHLFRYRGITTGEQLAKVLYDCGMSIILGFNSFDDEIQKRMAGNAPDIVAKRNRTLEILVKAGFSSSNPTRLALGINPVTNLNYADAFEIYKWARVRNIYAVVTPSMVSGRARKDLWRRITPEDSKLVKLYTDIYRFNIEIGLSRLSRLASEGISAYAGGHPCNQVAAGLYVTLNGIVLSCPGSEDNVEGNIWKTRISEIWRNSANYSRRGTYNCHCIAKDGKSIPSDLYERVLGSLHS